jgi:hypothetical protein
MQGLGMVTQGVGFAQMLGGSAPASAIFQKIQGIAGKTFLPLAVIGQIMGLVMTIIDGVIKPGGPLDRRFKRDYSKESLRLDSLADKQEITFGRRVVRVTTISSQRGTSSQVRSNLDYVKTGVEVFDINGTFNKGMGVGTI